MFAGFEALTGLVLAVSGGPDSLALVRLAAHWRDLGVTVPLHVATVDHGLRADSAAEAEQVGRWARALGLPHEILVWRGEKPLSGVQERARDARYALLFQHARTVGADAVATAHHADDQWETILIRLAHGTGLAGLAGMARDQSFHGGRLLRPLLSLPKQALIEFCRRERQDFFSDPANSNQAFERARWRAAAPALRALGLTARRLAKLAERASKANAALDAMALDLLQRTKMPEGGVDKYNLQEMGDAPQAALERYLAMAVARVAGAPPPRLERLELFAQKLRVALDRRATFRATIGGCAARLDRASILTLRLEELRRRGRPRTAEAKELTELPMD
ncbi:MAG TPA: tRNA lysidine(34) synthetase TilS [Rhodoblastus sp.]|nr:tRNA lysidine(34) synthetase TilS [Rhodoblastus sp.]